METAYQMLRENFPNQKSTWSLKINWNFSLPVSLWMNGVVKAIVKITKKHLNTITRKYCFNKETLYTYFTETEYIINDQTVTALSHDINDFEAPALNPFPNWTAHSKLLICSIKKLGDIGSKRKWKAVRVALTLFWQIWIGEHLSIIMTLTRNFLFGELVLIADKNIHRSNWSLARITEIHQLRTTLPESYN